MLYLLGIVLSWFQGWLGLLVYACVAVMWLVPDRRIEKKVANEGTREGAGK